MLMKQASRFRSFLPGLLALAVALFFGAGAVQAQDGGSNQPEYAAQFKEAMATAKEGVSLQKSDDVEGAVEKYEAAYRQLAKVADMAKEAGSVENATKAQRLSAQMAYRAGSLLHNNDQSKAAIAHFEFGRDIAPPSYTKNTTGLKAARASLKKGPVVDASRALRDGNPRRTLELLSGLEEQTATSYFYQALAHQELDNSESAIGYAGRALEAGGLSTSKQRRLHLLMGEENMKLGNNEAAREALAQAADMGSDRAEALIKQL